MPALQGETQFSLKGYLRGLPPWVNADLVVADANGNTVFQHDTAAADDPSGYEELSHAKLAIAHAAGLLVNRGEVNWSDAVQLGEQHRRGGNGFMRYLPDGYPVSLGDTVGQMLKTSDNTGMIAAVDILGGHDRVNTVLAEDSPLCEQVPGMRLVPDETDPERFWCTSEIRAGESAALLADLLKHPIFRSYLEHGNFRNGLRRDIDQTGGLPLGDRAWLALAKVLHRSGLGPSKTARENLLTVPYPRTNYPNKEATDAADGIFHDVAKIGPYIVSLLTKGWGKGRDRRNHDAHILQGRIGRTIKIHERA